MEPVSMSNFTAVAAGSQNRGLAPVDNNVEVGCSLVPFARVINEALSRTTSQEGLQPASTVLPLVSSSSTSQKRQSGSCTTTPRSVIPQGPVGSAVSFDCAAAIPTVAPFPLSNTQDDLAAGKAASLAGDGNSSVSFLGPDSGTTQASPAAFTAPIVEKQQATAPGDSVSVRPSATSPAMQTSPATQDVISPLVDANPNGMERISAGIVDKGLTAGSMSASAANDRGPAKITDGPSLQVGGTNATKEMNPSDGVSISSILPNLASLQPMAQLGVSMRIAHPPESARAALGDFAMRNLLATAPFLAAHSLRFTVPESNARLESTAGNQLPSSQEVATTSCSQTISQDKSSSHGGLGQGNGATNSEPSAPREDSASAFAATMADASAAGIKPSATSSPTAQAPVVASAPLHVDRLSTNTSTTPEATSANSLPVPAHTLESTTNRFVSDAQISQTAGHSEMHIAVQTDKLGAVELRARVAGDEVGAAITVEKRDAHAALAVELPALQQALSEKQLRVEHLSLLQGALHSTTSNAGGESQTQQGDRGMPRSQSASSSLQRDGIGLGISMGALEAAGIFDAQGRLSVLA